MALLNRIESQAIALRETPPPAPFLQISSTAPTITLPMERPLHTPPLKPQLDDTVAEADDDLSINSEALFAQHFIDQAALRTHLRQALQIRPQITLHELLEEHPLQQGLAELVSWLSIASDDPHHIFDESEHEILQWQDAQGERRSVKLPRVIYSRTPII